MKIRGTAVTTPIARHAVADDTTVSRKPWSSKNTVAKCCPSFTESGSVVACNPVEGYPLNVVSHIEPVQSGSGDPSPENVRPITGRGQVKVWRGGKNLISAQKFVANGVLGEVDGVDKVSRNGEDITCVFNSTGNYLNCRGQFVWFAPGTYTLFIFSNANFMVNVNRYRTTVLNNANKISGAAVKSNTPHTFKVTEPFILTIGGSSSGYGKYTFRLQLEAGSTATEYEPYRGEEITLDLGQTVYGGNLDWKTGLLTITHENIESYAGEDVPDGWISSTGELSTGAQVVYPIAEPVTDQLTPQELLGLSGTNTLYSDTGNTDVSGKADPTSVIEKLTNAIIALGGNV